MLDTTDRANLKQLSVVSFGKDTGPTTWCSAVTTIAWWWSDYFLNEDDAGIIHFRRRPQNPRRQSHAQYPDRGHAVSTRFQHGISDRPGASARDCDEVRASVHDKNFSIRGATLAMPGLGLRIGRCLRRLPRRARFAPLAAVRGRLPASTLLCRSYASGISLRQAGKSAGLWDGSRTCLWRRRARSRRLP